MKKLKLDNINLGNYYEDKAICDRLLAFDNCTIDISVNSIIVERNQTKLLVSNLRKIENDGFSETYLGSFEDGAPFRIIRPSDDTRKIFILNGIAETLSFGGMTPDSYAVHFDLM